MSVLKLYHLSTKLQNFLIDNNIAVLTIIVIIRNTLMFQDKILYALIQKEKTISFTFKVNTLKGI
jgi:hypothetical protein